ncbi:GNAT family N-acetyltransferase [Pilimelia columellifera]|uniref:GNAT family N-acetyltransferase n=1 Tax=Pilimelia columellifera TaxID=706574 RepID=UPI0031D6CD21
MKLREWDVRTAPADEIASLLAVLNAGLAVDLPDDPQWQADHFREYMAELMPGQRRKSWIAESDASLVGHMSLLGMADAGVIELLVDPRRRTHGLGRQLLAGATRWAAANGYTSLGVEVPGGTPAVAFYEGLGFRLAYAEIRSVLTVAAMDWPMIGEMAEGVGSGYRLEYHAGGPPPELLASYATAKSELPGAGGGSPTDPDAAALLRESIACLRRRGLEPHVVVALHLRTGEVAGLTEVVVPAQRPERADQYDTIIVPDHRGYGIDRAIKARMLLELRTAAPQVRQVQTWNAPDDHALLKINSDIGFRPDRQWLEFEADVATLLARLDS